MIVPLVGFIVVPLGLVTGFLSLILPSAAGFWCGREYLLSATLWLVRLFAHLPLANVAVPVPNAFEVTALYLFIVALFLFCVKIGLRLWLSSYLHWLWEPTRFIGGVNDGTEKSCA